MVDGSSAPSQRDPSSRRTFEQLVEKRVQACAHVLQATIVIMRTVIVMRMTVIIPLMIVIGIVALHSNKNANAN